jgi:hypothetical protein
MFPPETAVVCVIPETDIVVSVGTEYRLVVKVT